MDKSIPYRGELEWRGHGMTAREAYITIPQQVYIESGGGFLELIRINQVVLSFGISSRTLRYYEEKGLLWSHHPDNTAIRHYDAAALERLKQIIILRKLQIPIKDIVAIFESKDMAVLIQSFVKKLDALDEEITALAELKGLVDDFLNKMLTSGIKKISAITLLYEETEKRLAVAKENETISLEKLSQVSRKVSKLGDVRVIRLSAMRVLTTRLKMGGIESLAADEMLPNPFKEYGFVPRPAFHNFFFQQEDCGNWIVMIKIPLDYENETPYMDRHFEGGLYAASSSFMDDMAETFELLRDWVAQSDTFEGRDGKEVAEEVVPRDIAAKLGMYQYDMYVPIKMKEEGQNG